MKWDSPWGVGYPGWHIECSVMARELLGHDLIDIHTGGEDLIFPHHECEIAQSCGASGQDTFARFWIHARFLFVEGEKMSKSRGNFFTARDIFEGKKVGGVQGREVQPEVLRLELIKAHYRTNMNFTEKGLADSATTVRRFMELRQQLDEKTGGQAADVDLSHPILEQFMAALADDLNIAGALAVVIPWAGGSHPDPHLALGVWKKVNSVLSVAPINEGIAAAAGMPAAVDPRLEQAQGWCRELDAARAAKNFSLADELRKRIQDAGFEVRTTKDGTVIQKSLA
jgi:cysteinyl-tRNA synthetase